MNCKPAAFFPAWQVEGAVTDPLIEAQKPCCSHRTADVSGVGADRLDHNLAAVEDELDRLIAELHEQSRLAHERGDPTGARLYLDRADAARRSRSEEHQERLHQRAWQRMLDEDYFGAMGQQDRERTA
jgi:hypothetical protein